MSDWQDRPTLIGGGGIGGLAAARRRRRILLQWNGFIANKPSARAARAWRRLTPHNLRLNDCHHGREFIWLATSGRDTSSRHIERGEGPRAGIVIGDEVFDAAKLTGKAPYATVAGKTLPTGKQPKARCERPRPVPPKAAPSASRLEKPSCSAGSSAPSADDILCRRELRRPRRRNGAQARDAGAGRSA